MIDPRAPPFPLVEYLIQTVDLPIADEVLTDKLNILGQDGWKLMFVTTTNAARLWFAREYQEVLGEVET